MADGRAWMEIIWAALVLRANTGDYYRKNIVFPFFEQYLKGNGDGEIAEGLCIRDGNKCVAAVRVLAAQKYRNENTLFPSEGWLVV